MRRSRITRASSAQSLCIFCACRFRAIDLAASTTSASFPTRRHNSTTRPLFQSAASPSPDPISAAPELPSWFDPTSSLSLTEQREKRERVAQRQKLEEAKKAQSMQERSRYQDALEKAATATEAKDDTHATASPQQTPFTTSTQGSRSRQISELSFRSLGPGAGGIKSANMTMKQAMAQAPQGRQSERDIAARKTGNGQKLNIRKVSQPTGIRITKFLIGEKDGLSGAGRSKTTDMRRNNQKAPAPAPSFAAPVKVAPPSFIEEPREKVATPEGGWGMGSIEARPLRYRESHESPIGRPVLKAGPEEVNVQSALASNSAETRPSDPAVFKAISETQDGQLSPNQIPAGQTQVSTPTPPQEVLSTSVHAEEPISVQEHVDTQVEHAVEAETQVEQAADHPVEVETQVEQAVDHPVAVTSDSNPPQASKSFTSEKQSEPESPLATPPKTDPPRASVEVASREQQEAVSRTEPLTTKSTGPASPKAPSSTSSQEQQTLPPRDLFRDNAAAAAPVNTNIFNHVEDTTREALRQESSPPRAAWGLSTVSPSTSSADFEKRTPGAFGMNSAPAAAPAAAPPAVHVAAPAAAASPPPPPAAVPAPAVPPPAVSPPTVPPPSLPPQAAGTPQGQIAWQPIEGHPQGGQWVWQPSPAAVPTPAPQASQAPLRRITPVPEKTYPAQAPPNEPTGLPATPAHSKNIFGDSGYKAVPFNPSEHEAEFTRTPEPSTADWQHLRRKKSEADQPAEPTKPAEPAKSAEPVKSAGSVKSAEPAKPATILGHSQPPPPPPQTPQPSTSQQWSFQPPPLRTQESQPQDRFNDDSWVEMTFAQHWQKRQMKEAERKQQNQTVAPSVNPQPLFPEESHENKTCVRCGQKGHIGRNCPQRALSRSVFKTDPQGHTANVSVPFRPPPLGSSGRPHEQQGGIQSPFQQGGPEQLNYSPFATQQPAPQRPLGIPGGVRVVGVRPQGSAEPRSEPDTPGSLRVEDADSESKDRREKALRRSKWIEDEEKDSVATSRGAGRKVARGGRREFDEDADEEEDARESFRARKAARQKAKEEEKEQRRKMARREREGKNSENATPITLPEFISVQQLSQQLGVRYEEFIERLEDLGYDDVFPGMTLNSEISGMIAMEFNFEPSFELAAREEEERDLKARPDVDDKEFLPVRPPVVTIMGHVDHGKTTILDYLRKSSVAAGEAGGITQHIGAFSVPLASSGRTITFLDTPGHAAFLAMRQRGANVTDIVILVVAADDSVKPQTLEAIKHAKAAGVPMIVAVNKVDKEDANVDRVKQDLARHGVEIEDYGGDTQVVPVSGKTGLGMDDLEENIVTLSEILDHRAETDGPVEGWVLEATTKKAGRVATVLVRRGTLRPGAVLVAGRTWARVRTLRNEGGQNLSEIGPGMPIEVDGWKDQPMAGDEVLQAPSEQKATSVVEYRTEIHEREKAAKDIEAINEARKQAVERQAKEKAAEQASKQAQRAAVQEGGAADVAKSPDDLDRPEAERTGQIVVPFVIKADVSGSAEAVSAYIMSVSHPLVAPSILRVGVGEVHESDIELAAVAHGYIIAFNLPSDPETQGLAESKGVRVLENNIIYRVLDDVKAVLEDKLPPIVSQRVLGEAEVSIPFEIGVGGRKKMKIAGCKVRNGLVKNNSRVRVMRGSKKVYDGLITSLKNVKKDVSEMRKGTECGMAFENWEDFEVGDQIQAYEEISEKRKL